MSFIITMLRGRHVRHGSKTSSLIWLTTILLIGDLWAVLTFGVPLEIALLTLAAFLFALWWIDRLPDWNALGQIAWAFSIVAAGLYLAYTFAVTAFTPLHPLAFVVAVVLFFIELAALFLTLTYTFETLDAGCRIRWNRRIDHLPSVTGYFPKVSLHVPAYNEPPEVVAATLRALARLDYPDFEVLLVDNNTPDESIWLPIETLCHELGPRFRFLHLDRWPGYKSGALNFALSQTAPDAEIIGVIDADYLVRPEYLRDLAPAFADDQLAFLQTPQDYRDYQRNPFLRASYHAYKYFFEVSMPLRNEHNAIIFGGTMGLIRKSVLQKVGGWDEWCITEDAELSLRILKEGYKSVFIHKTYGRGLMPFTFEGLKRQRFRWCFGGIQILKKHWFALIPWATRFDPHNHLTLAQRYFYLVGGLQWFNDLINLFFAAILILAGIFLVSPAGMGIRPLTSAFIVMPVLFLSMGLWRFLWTLGHLLQLSWSQALAAMGNFFSLGWAVTLGSIQGLIQPQGIFMRTPKTKSNSGLARAFRVTQWETGIGLTCLAAGVALPVLRPQLSTLFLACLLAWQASLYLSAPLYSLISARYPAFKPEIGRANITGWEVSEARAARWAVALLLLLLAGVGLFQFLPQPGEQPQYARFQPADVSSVQILGFNAIPILERGRRSTPSATSLAPTPSPTLDMILAPTEVRSATPSILPAPLQPSPTAIPPRGDLPTPTPTPGKPPQPSATPLPSNPPTTSTPTSAEPVLTPFFSPTPPQPTQPVIPSQSPPPTSRPASPSPTSMPSPTWPAPSQAPTNPANTQTPLPTPSGTPDSPVQTQIPSSPAPTPTWRAPS